MHDEIKHRLKAGNGCYFAISHLFKSKLLSEKTKGTLISRLSDRSCLTHVVPELQQQ